MAFGNVPEEGDSMMSEINVTPLVDVMLVLLVVFIITAPLLAPQSLKINLPKTEAVAHDNTLKKFSLAINAKGEVFYESLHLNEDALAQMLGAHAADPSFELQIQADAAVPYGRVAQIMAMAQKSGIAKLSFLTVTAK